MQPGATAEIRFALAQHVEPSPSAGRKPGAAAPVSKGLNAAQRFFQRLGL